jgi:MFS transporter, Spinster family, sphingosine-1-phosphate transporter
MPQKTYAYAILAVLTGLNILNYVDRNVLFAVQPLVKSEFGLTDTQLGVLTSAFFFSYMFAAPLAGWMGDRFARRNIVVVGITIWSGFTLLTWWAADYGQLLFRHTVVGIGEASYAAIAPALIADAFPIERRGRMLSIFFLALPVGSAAGYLVGGYFAHHFGWRMPFMIAGAPGFMLALLLWFLPEPPRGQTEAVETSRERSTLLGLLGNGAFITVCLGMALYTFAVGGLQVWIPTFLVRIRHVPLDKANALFGLITLFNGIVATLLGGWIGDRMLKRWVGAYYTFSGIAMLAAVPLMVAAIYVSGKFMFPAIFLAVFALLIGTAPSNAALVNSIGANIRSTALAVNVFVIHLLGDAFSPTLIGRISDKTNLQTAFTAAFFAAALSGVIFLYGARYAPRLVAPTVIAKA